MDWGKEKYWNVLSNLIKEFSLCLFSYGNSLSDFEEAGPVVWNEMSHSHFLQFIVLILLCTCCI